MSTNAREELERYPKYKEAYIRAFERMLIAREDLPTEWKNGKEVLDWWLQE
jgi:phosphoadenosine phosphosulfate reductase